MEFGYKWGVVGLGVQKEGVALAVSCWDLLTPLEPVVGGGRVCSGKWLEKAGYAMDSLVVGQVVNINERFSIL